MFRMLKLGSFRHSYVSMVKLLFIVFSLLLLASCSAAHGDFFMRMWENAPPATFSNEPDCGKRVDNCVEIGLGMCQAHRRNPLNKNSDLKLCLQEVQVYCQSIGDTCRGK